MSLASRSREHYDTTQYTLHYISIVFLLTVCTDLTEQLRYLRSCIRRVLQLAMFPFGFFFDIDDLC